MSILAVSAGIVTAVRGEAYVRSPQGDLIAVKVGDKLPDGQPILGPNGEVLEVAAAPTARAQTEIDDAIANLDTPQGEEEAPAAGLTGGEGGSLGLGLRVDRVSEAVSPQSFGFGTPDAPAPSAPLPGAFTDQRSLTNPEPETPQPPEPPVSLPFLTVFGQDAVEGQAVEFTVGLTQAPVGPVTVRLDLLPGTDAADAAQPGIDTATALEYFNTATQQWTAVSGDLSFAPGQTAIRVRVATLDDQDVEGVEFIQLRATVTSGETVNSVNWSDTAITDNDKPFLVVYGQDTTEGEHAGFTVNLTQPSSEPVTVRLALLAGSDPVDAAEPGVDSTGPLEYFNTISQAWETVTGDLTLAPGQTQIQVRVATVDDAEIEGLEFLQLQATVISGDTANAESRNDTAITDNDKPYMVVFSEDAIEGQHAHYSVNLTSVTGEVVSVSLALQAGGTPLLDAALPGVDSANQLEYFDTSAQQWLAVTGPLSFQPGDTRIDVRVPTLDDAEVEPVEFLRLQATVVEGNVINPVTWNDVAITDNEGRTVVGTSDADEVLGQAGADVLQGRAGDDLLYGGQGDDRLRGDEGGDVFAWRLSDVVTGRATVDRIEDFDLAPHGNGGDVLDLRDLLQGEYSDGGVGNLGQYLHFDTSGSDTRVQISVSGDLTDGQGTITQEIVLQGVNLRTAFGLETGAGDGAIIARMLADQKLWVDAA